MVLNEEQWIKELREKRIAYGISQGRLAVVSGITREYLNKIESGKMKPSKELLETLHKELARFNPEAPLTMLFDYVKIRFPTLDIQHIIKDILKLNINYMLHEDYGRYSYTEHYSLGDIFIYTSADEEKGVLLELKGRGCRQNTPHTSSTMPDTSAYDPNSRPEARYEMTAAMPEASSKMPAT